jgi:hypothetical protein
LVITSTPAGRFVYWPDCKHADLTDDNSCCIAYLETLPFQEGTPLATNEEEHTPTEVATTDSSLCTPNCEVFMAAGDAGTSEEWPDRYLNDISEVELTTNAPPKETTEDKNARCDHNRKRNDRRRRLRESLPIRNLNEALDQVANWVHTTPEQCIKSITMIARQALGMSTSCGSTTESLPLETTKRLVAAAPQQTADTTASVVNTNQHATTLEPLREDPRTVAIAAGRRQQQQQWRQPSHGGGRRAGGGGDRGGRGHANSHATGYTHDSYDARHRIDEIHHAKKATEISDGFPAYSARLRDLLLPEKFKPLRITKYDAKQDPVQ